MKESPTRVPTATETSTCRILPRLHTVGWDDVRHIKEHRCGIIERAVGWHEVRDIEEQPAQSRVG